MRLSKPIVVVELDLDTLDDASLTATNSDGTKCYKTPATTDSWAEGALTTRTIALRRVEDAPVAGLDAPPALSSVSYSDDSIKLGEGLSEFGSLSATWIDEETTDLADDPFAASRMADALMKGRRWRRLLARNPYMTGRAVRLKVGEWAPDVGAITWTTRHYAVRALTLHDNGTVSLEAVSPLQLLSLGEIETPGATPGKLVAEVDAGQTTIALDTFGAGEYPTAGTVRVDDELIDYTGVSDTTLTGCTRGARGTTAEAHQAEASAQVCIVYTDAYVDTMLVDLFERMGVAASYIDTAAWAAVRNNWLETYRLSVVLSEPERGLDLVRSLLYHVGAYMWFDPEHRAIRLEALRPPLTPTVAITDDELLAPVTRKIEAGKRVSRCDFAIGLRTPVANADRAVSYHTRILGAPQGEEAYEHGEPARKFLKSRWFASAQAALAFKASTTITRHFRDGRILYLCRITATKAASLPVGTWVDLTTEDNPARDTVGETTVRGLVVRRTVKELGAEFEIAIEKGPQHLRYAIFEPVGAANYGDTNEEDRVPGGYFAGADERMPNGDAPYVFN